MKLKQTKVSSHHGDAAPAFEISSTISRMQTLIVKSTGCQSLAPQPIRQLIVGSLYVDSNPHSQVNRLSVISPTANQAVNCGLSVCRLSARLLPCFDPSEQYRDLCLLFQLTQPLCLICMCKHTWAQACTHITHTDIMYTHTLSLSLCPLSLSLTHTSIKEYKVIYKSMSSHANCCCSPSLSPPPPPPPPHPPFCFWVFVFVFAHTLSAF